MNNSSIAPYRFNDNDIRVILNGDGDPLFKAADVCNAVNVSNPSMAVSRLDDDEKVTITLTDSEGKPHKTLFLTEPGLNKLVMTSRSRDPIVKQFQRWIAHEVLPSIRKTGSYVSNPAPTSTQALLLAVQKLVDIETEQMAQAARINELEAKVDDISDKDYWTVKNYCKSMRIKGSPALFQEWGRQARKLSEDRGFEVRRSPDPDFGSVGTYHHSVLGDVIRSKPTRTPGQLSLPTGDK